MYSVSEIISLITVVNDILRFSYLFDRPKCKYEKYISDEWGLNSLAADEICHDTISNIDPAVMCRINSTVNKIDSFMPLGTIDIQAVRSHFASINESDIKSFFPEKLYSAENWIPTTDYKNCDEYVKESITQIKRDILEIKKGTISLDYFLSDIENWCSLYSIDSGHTSFFEFLKLKAGMANIIYHSSIEEDAVDPYSILVCSVDFIGIKEFKFQKALNNKLSLIRTASLFIDLFRENFLDEFFQRVELNRSNVIFCGGRHIHLFLPNTNKIKESLRVIIAEVNDWIVSEFGTKLYLSYGYSQIEFRELFSERPDNLYVRVFEKIASMKMKIESSKYSVNNLMTINTLLSNCYDEKMLSFSKKLSELDNRIKESNNAVLAISGSDEGIPIFPNRFISLETYGCNEVRRYCSKTQGPIDQSSIPIWLNIYNYDLEFEDLESKDSHYPDILILRVDIDDFKKRMLALEQLSVHKSPDPIFQMMLSKEFALFLRHYLYRIANKYKKLAVVHEGADDLFAVGNSYDIACFSVELSQLYKLYSNGKMTISAGISKYVKGSSFSRAANDAQELMNISKSVPGKNSITVLDSNNTLCFDTLSYNDILSKC